MEKFLTFNRKDYPYNIEENLPDTFELFNAFKHEIKEKNDMVLSDLITETADESIDIYTDSLVRNCASVPFMKYIEESISEFGHSSTYEQQLRLAEFCYYFDALTENFDTIVRNALNEYLETKTIIINGPEKDVGNIAESVYQHINSTIDTFSVDIGKRASDILDIFEQELCQYLETVEEHSKNVKVKLADADDEEATITGLCVEPDKQPYVVKIPLNNQLAFLQDRCGGYIEVLPLYSNRTDGLEIDMIVNEEGKILHLPENRIITENDLLNNHSTQPVDIVCGNAVIVAANEEGEWVSLPEDELLHWGARFLEPMPHFIGSRYLDDETIEIPDFVSIKKDIIDINEHGRGDDDAR